MAKPSRMLSAITTRSIVVVTRMVTTTGTKTSRHVHAWIMTRVLPTVTVVVSLPKGPKTTPTAINQFGTCARSSQQWRQTRVATGDGDQERTRRRRDHAHLLHARFQGFLGLASCFDLPASSCLFLSGPNLHRQGRGRNYLSQHQILQLLQR
jgi:hypothetical protein